MELKTASTHYDFNWNEGHNVRSVGFDLDPTEKLFITKRLARIEDLAPAMSFVKLTFFKEKSLIKGSLSIVGAGKTFRSICRGTRPKDIVQLLEKDIKKQLRRWKGQRVFDNLSSYTKINDDDTSHKVAYF